MNTILKYPGAKNRLAEWIVSFIPYHQVYLEPFFGSGAVFFNKPASKIETINDIDNNVYNLFKVIRNNPDELAKILEMTPYSRAEYDNSYVENIPETDMERARKFLVRCWMGFGNSNVYKNGFRSSQQSRSPCTTKHWNQLPERILLASERLKNAQIENLDALELLIRYNTDDVFVYMDPPYLNTLRKGYLYNNEMSEKEHIRLLEMVIHHPAKFLISGYDSDIYNYYLKNWNTAEKETQAEQGLKRREKLWFNYELEYQFDFG